MFVYAAHSTEFKIAVIALDSHRAIQEPSASNFISKHSHTTVTACCNLLWNLFGSDHSLATRHTPWSRQGLSWSAVKDPAEQNTLRPLADHSTLCKEPTHTSRGSVSVRRSQLYRLVFLPAGLAPLRWQLAVVRRRARHATPAMTETMTMRAS